MKQKARIVTCLLAVLLLVTSFLPTVAFADESTKITKSNAISSDYYYWGGQMIQYTFTYYDGTTITTNHGGFALHYAGENVTGIVGSQVAYCIEPDTGSTTGTTYNGTAAENSSYWLNKLSPQQQNAIKLILLYGAPNSLYSTDARTLFGYEGATQILIWEIVMGLRSPVAPYTLNDSRMKNNFYNNSAFPSTKTGYDTIIAKMQAHLNIPSFASYYLNQAQTYMLDYDAASGLYKKTLTDTNGVLSQDYTFSAPGITFSKNGNVLNISAPASAFAGGDVTASATGSSLSLSSLTQMIWTLPGKQTVTTFQASPDPMPCYLKLKVDGGTATIQKTSDTDDVSGYCFKIYKWTDNSSWYGKSDSDGKVYVTNSSYAASGTKNYTFSGLNDGTYTFLEVLSQKGKDLVFPDSWTITVTRAGQTVFNKTYTAADLTRDSNGDCRLNKIAITGLTGGGVLAMTIHNAPETGDLEIVKTSTDGKVSNISFVVEQYEATGGIGWWEMGTYKTNANGKILIGDLPVGTKLRIREIVPEGYECTTENPQTITLKRGTNTVTFNNKPTTTSCEIIKTSTDGAVSGISFKVEQYETGTGWRTKGTYSTDASGKITIGLLPIGTRLRITEIVPQDYVCTSDNPQTITLAASGNQVRFTNKPIARLEIVKTSTDGKIDGISFKVEKKSGGSWTALGTYVSDTNGKISAPNLDVGLQLRITETVPENYVCTSTNPQTITLVKGTNRVSFANKPIATLEIVKTSTDGEVAGISFKVEKKVSNSWSTVGTYVSDANGKISVPNLDVGLQLRITETVPENYVCTSTNPQTITLVKGVNRVSFANKPIASLEIIKTSTDGKIDGITFKVECRNAGRWIELGSYVSDQNGKILIEGLDVGLQLRITETVPEYYACTTDNPQTITLVKGANSVSFSNKPIASLEIIKTSTDGKIDGITFKVERRNAGRWVEMGSYVSDQYGRILLEGLDVGLQLRITELVPENYECLSANPQTLTLVQGMNRVSFENRPYVPLEIIKTSDNGFVEGIRFRVEQFEPEGGIGWWEMGIYQTDSEGKILLDPMPVGTRLRITELVPDGYICESENPQTVTLAETDNQVRFENRRIFGNLEIIKVDESYPDTRLSGAEFTVTVTYPGKEPVDMLMPEVLDAEGKGTGVYRLEHIEYGSVCLVRETKAPEGFLLSEKTFTVTIEEETTYNISDPGFDCLTNREKSGIIQVKKVDTQGRAMSGVSFLLEFSLDGRRWAPVTYREDDSAVTTGGCTNELLANGILVTDQNGVAIYPGLALTLGDRVLHYRLTELSTQNGMQLLPEPAFEGTLPYNGAEEITVTAVNSDGFTIPETGGSGFTLMSLGFAIAGGAALLLLLMLRKRRGYCV